MPLSSSRRQVSPQPEVAFRRSTPLSAARSARIIPRSSVVATMLVSTLMLILSTAIGASASVATADAGISTMYHFDAMSRGIEPLDKSTFVQSYAEYYQLRQQMRAHASAAATIDDAPGPYRHLEESEAQMEFTEECVSALMSSPNTDDRLISQVEFAEFLNGLTDDESMDLMFHNLYWTRKINLDKQDIEELKGILWLRTSSSRRARLTRWRIFTV